MSCAPERSQLLDEVMSLRSELALHMNDGRDVSPQPHASHDQRQHDVAVELASSKKIQDIIKKLNMKINKLYSWHLVELDLVSRQQVQCERGRRRSHVFLLIACVSERNEG